MKKIIVALAFLLAACAPTPEVKSYHHQFAQAVCNVNGYKGFEKVWIEAYLDGGVDLYIRCEREFTMIFYFTESEWSKLIINNERNQIKEKEEKKVEGRDA